MLPPVSLEPQPSACLAVESSGAPSSANAALLALLDIDGLDALLTRFSFIDPQLGPLAGPQLPWARVADGERIDDERQVWVDRRSGRRHWLQLRGCELDGARGLEIRADAAGGLVELARLTAAIAERGLAADDPRSLAVALVDRVRSTLGARGAWIFGPSAADARELAVQAASGTGADLIAASLLEPSAPAAEAAARREARFADHLDAATAAAGGSGPAWQGALAGREIRSLGALPLLADGGALHGVVCVGLQAPEGLAPAEREALSAACAAWAAALGRHAAREVERRARSSMQALAQRAQRRPQAEQPLRELLRVLVEQACALTRARYGAMGVLNREHTDLEDFVVHGISDEQAARIGHLPTGKGLLGAVIHDAQTIRVAEIARDARSYGFPQGHPPMHSFLGSPLRIGDEVYGNFYLTDKEGGAEFTEDDARVLEAFSAQASLTVGYARETGAQRRLLDAMLRHAPHGILFFVSDDQIAFGNSAAERMLGLPHRAAGAAAGARLGEAAARGFDLQHPDGRPLLPREFLAARALRGEVVANQELRVVRPGEPPLPVLASAAPVWSETGAMLGAVVVFQDVSAYKELERLREEFAAVVAHDLRNPVQAILMQLEMLARRAEGGAVEVPVPALQRMQRSGQRLAHLISDLLDAARIEGGRVNLDRRPVDLAAAAASLVEQIEPTLGKHVVRLHTSQPAPPPVSADRLRVEQVLTNLLENAAKYSAEGSPIDIAVEPSGDGAVVSVSDCGPGIQPEDLPRLFDRYYQTRRAREKRSGLGLGLFITKGLVEAHGGRLWVESTAGRGTRFYVWLPADRATEVHAPLQE